MARFILGPMLAGLLSAPGAAAAAPFTYRCSAPLSYIGHIMQVQPEPTYRVRGRFNFDEVDLGD
jgi:hypothetical protein